MRDADSAGTWDPDELHETPVTARARVKRVANSLIVAELDLKRRREDELHAELARDAAADALEVAATLAMLNDDAPKVERNGATVAEKQAWVERKVRPQQELLKDAVVRLKGAKMLTEGARRHYDRLNTQIMAAQAVLKSIDRAMSIGTHGDA